MRSDKDERDEYVCIGVDAFIRAIEHFNPALGLRLLTYAWASIRRAILNERRAVGLVRAPVKKPISKSAREHAERARRIASIHPHRDGDRRGIQIRARPERDVWAAEYARVVPEVLGGREWEVVRMRASGMTYAQIAASIGRKPQRAEQIFRAACRKLTTQGLNLEGTPDRFTDRILLGPEKVKDPPAAARFPQEGTFA